jgi:HD-GYP domain-containing protein (c-di-GMP phosphodiesterase class II)
VLAWPDRVSEARTAASVPSLARLEALMKAMATHDVLTYQHSARVQRWATLLGGEALCADEETLATIGASGLLHDVGKLGIADRLLNKPGPLTPEEYRAVKRHVTIGADLLAAVGCAGSLILAVRHHHENWDGTGYPDGLTREEIPLGSRVLAIADGYDALISDRPYRRAWTHDRAVAALVQWRGTRYDPAITDAFLRILRRQSAATPGDAQASSQLEARAQ